MHFFIIIVISIFSGIFAGMGMGGGTFLIPLLYLIYGTSQVVLQSTNIISFIGLAAICFVIYIRSHFIDFEALFFVAIPATFLSFIGAIFAIKISSNVLHILFSIFIILIGIFSLVSSVLKIGKKRV